MTLTIHADTEMRTFEVCTKNQRFAAYPSAFYGRAFGDGERYVCANLNGRRWYAELCNIAAFVNDELGEECLFEVC